MPQITRLLKTPGGKRKLCQHVMSIVIKLVTQKFFLSHRFFLRITWSFFLCVARACCATTNTRVTVCGNAWCGFVEESFHVARCATSKMKGKRCFSAFYVCGDVRVIRKVSSSASIFFLRLYTWNVSTCQLCSQNFMNSRNFLSHTHNPYPFLSCIWTHELIR